MMIESLNEYDIMPVVELWNRVCLEDSFLYQPLDEQKFRELFMKGSRSDYRQYGAGKVLFSTLCKGLKELGAEYMTLFTGETNPACYIYESADFKIVRTWADMRKELDRDGK